mmetsp:Transcript_39790/g.69903  ORF Transcript_39790/g.69903 Transcript_39790/m.69903 type:complete len:568 (+) Transcript_39790:62-1765(+)
MAIMSVDAAGAEPSVEPRSSEPKDAPEALEKHQAEETRATAAVEEARSSEAEESWDEEDWDDYSGWPTIHEKRGSGGGQRSHHDAVAAAAVAKQAQLQRLQARINFDFMPQTRATLSHKAQNEIIRSEKKADAARNLGLTQDTRATTEGVLDPRTMLVLSKFLKRELFKEIHGCISTGKEANVYYATADNGVERAVKVYKTSILVFKDRARYVEGEFRFRNGYCKGNPRKMVAQWAEKEMRNLRRLQAAGIRCPGVIEVRQNVLVMDFIGDEGNAAPRLKDTENVGREEWCELYVQCVLIMRQMFQQCKLVHGDLSEYNMLYHAGEIVIIDVSQSVECDHPQCLDFLKRDCVNVNNFFAKRGELAPLPVRILFDFVVMQVVPRVGEAAGPMASDEDALRALLESSAEAGDKEREMDDTIFVQTWIPSHLDQVCDRKFMDDELAKRQRGEELTFARLLAPDAGVLLKSAEVEGTDELEAEGAEASVDPAPEADAASAGQDEEADDDEDGSDAEDLDDDALAIKNGHKPEGMSKQEWKALVKAERAEKRKDKVPKAVKKKYRKQAAKGR